MHTIHLRRATDADVETLVDIHMISRERAMPWLPVLHARAETILWMRELVLPAQAVWLAEAAGRIAGYMALEPGHLEQLYIHPEFQSMGIGTQLLAKAKQLSPQGLSLLVFQRNARARGFYEAHGFILAELTDGAANQEQEPDARYVWAGEVTAR